MHKFGLRKHYFIRLSNMKCLFVHVYSESLCSSSLRSTKLMSSAPVSGKTFGKAFSFSFLSLRCSPPILLYPINKKKNVNDACLLQIIQMSCFHCCYIILHSQTMTLPVQCNGNYTKEHSGRIRNYHYLCSLLTTNSFIITYSPFMFRYSRKRDDKKLLHYNHIFFSSFLLDFPGNVKDKRTLTII